MAQVNKSASNYGIAEWYGRLHRSLNIDEQKEMLSWGSNTHCRFMQDTILLAPKKGPYCNKAGGVCSIRNFDTSQTELSFGEITATCPAQFLEGGLLVAEIGKLLLGTSNPLIAKEIPFLKRPPKSKVEYESIADEADDSTNKDDNETKGLEKDVGKIDMVCVHPDLEELSWCAVEMQAVYFSGAKFGKDREVIRKHAGNSFPLPGGSRRPDYRSSGPKRLMPQLQIKVPTLRRWGKKMVVVVDKPFFDALGEMQSVDHVSNADIVWIIVQFTDDLESSVAKMSISQIRYTTLEHAVEGLTAGVPTTLPDFEQNLRKRLGAGKKRKGKA